MSDFLGIFSVDIYAMNVSSKDTRESPMRPRFDQQKKIKFLLSSCKVLLVSFMEKFILTYGIAFRHLWRCGQAVQQPSPPQSLSPNAARAVQAHEENVPALRPDHSRQKAAEGALQYKVL